MLLRKENKVVSILWRKKETLFVKGKTITLSQILAPQNYDYNGHSLSLLLSLPAQNSYTTLQTLCSKYWSCYILVLNLIEICIEQKNETTV